jgi:branched-chain amino acid transport system substrate-binding protein
MPVKGDLVAGIDRRNALKLLGGLGAAGFASACGAVGGAEPQQQIHDTHVRIGLLVPGTGGYKPLGDDMLNGFNRYLRVTGNRLGGHPVVVEQRDEGDSPDSAMAALEDLLSADVSAVVGVASSAAMLEVSRRIEEVHIPLLGTNASPFELQGTPYVWRTSFVNDEPGRVLGSYLAGMVQGTVTSVAQDDPMGVDAVQGMREVFTEARGSSDQLADTIWTPMVTQPARDHFAIPLEQLRQMDAEAVFCCYAGNAAAEFIRQYVAAGLDPARLVAPAYLTEGAVLTAVGTDALGIRTSANYAPELRTSVNRAFASDYRREVGDAPTIYAVAAYDAAAALDKAIALSDGDLDPHEINLNLSRVGLIDSPRGRWQFNQGRTPTQKWYLREVASDGPVLSNLVIRELGTLG